MNTTTKLWWLCYKAIPLVFDNSLSYLEMLARLLEYVNNLKDALKELYEKVENLDEKVEQYYNDLLSRLDELETTLRNYIDSELQNCKEELLDTIEENNTAMNQKIQDFIDYINGLIGEVKDVCFNPTNGHYENVCKILQDIYTHMQIDAMTVAEFDSTNYITVEYFDDFGLTAQEFDLRSKLLLTDFWKNVVDEKLNDIGDLEDLKTLSKNTLVSAINEVQSTTVNQSGNISSLMTRMNTIEGEIDNLETGTVPKFSENKQSYANGLWNKLDTNGYSIQSSRDFYIETSGNNIIIGGFITLQGNNITTPLKIQLDNKEDNGYGYTPPFENSSNTDFQFMGMVIAVASSSEVIMTPLQCKVENNHIIIESFDFDGNTIPTLMGDYKYLCFPIQILSE